MQGSLKPPHCNENENVWWRCVAPCSSHDHLLVIGSNICHKVHHWPQWGLPHWIRGADLLANYPGKLCGNSALGSRREGAMDRQTHQMQITAWTGMFSRFKGIWDTFRPGMRFKAMTPTIRDSRTTRRTDNSVKIPAGYQAPLCLCNVGVADDPTPCFLPWLRQLSANVCGCVICQLSPAIPALDDSFELAALEMCVSIPVGETEKMALEFCWNCASFEKGLNCAGTTVFVCRPHSNAASCATRFLSVTYPPWLAMFWLASLLDSVDRWHCQKLVGVAEHSLFDVFSKRESIR